MILAVGVAALLLAGIVSATSLGVQKTLIGATVAALVVVPINLFGVGVGSSMSHTTIAAGRLSVSSHDVAIIAAVLLGGLGVIRWVRPEFGIVVIGSFVVAVLSSGLHSWVAEGIAQWAFLGLAWAFGAAVSSAVRRGQLSERFLAGTLALCVGLHTVASLAQLAGVGRVYQSQIAGGALARMTGLAGHPGNLGKIVFLLMLIALPLTNSSDARTRRFAWLTVTMSMVTIGLTFSRANVAAAVVVFGGWLLLQRGVSTVKRFGILLAGAVGVVPVVNILLERQQFDPDGGLRPELMRSAVAQLHRTFWWGVGPNDYIETVGQFDPYARGGLPVHSTFMLVLVELGAVLAVIAAIPLVLLVIKAVRTLLGSGLEPHAVVFLLALPGLFVILQTGHGMTSRVVAPTFFLTLGHLWAALSDVDKRLPPVLTGRAARGADDMAGSSR